jgi:hypothetical protein
MNLATGLVAPVSRPVTVAVMVLPPPTGPVVGLIAISWSAA